MKTIFVKFFFAAALFCTQFAVAQTTQAPRDADETPEKVAMKKQLREQRMQQIQVENQQAAKTTAAPIAKQSAATAGNPPSRYVAAGNTKAVAPIDNKNKLVRQTKPLGGEYPKVSAAPGTLLEKQVVQKDGKK